MLKTKSKSEWTSCKLSKTFLKSAIARAEEEANMPPGSIKAFGFVNSLLAKYAAGKLKEIK
jgi:hypothetical protein